MKLSVGFATDIGQVREGNEDSYLIEHPLFAVADGMGGALGGEVASGLAIETIHDLFSRREGDLVHQVEEANRAVFARSQTDRTVAGMGTTLTAALVDDGRVHLAHVGDSRAYLFRDGELALLTEDHTLVHRMVAAGEITPSEAEVHPHRSILTRVLGMDGEVDVDEEWLDVRPGDRILLCTDGLTGMLSEPQIGEILEASLDPQAAAERLVSSANRAGGIDNITAILLAFDEDGAGGDVAKPTTTSIGIAGERRATTAVETAPERRTTTTLDAGRAPRVSSTRPVRTRALVGVGIALGVIVLGLVGLRFYLDRQWYVGVDDGHVALFRGVPETVAGFDLHDVVTETEIRASEAEALALYRNLPDGITADDRESAEAIVAQIRADVAKAARRAST